MSTRFWTGAFLALGIVSTAGAARGATLVEEPVEFKGLCDASAAAALDADYFIAASDEDNTLRIYAWSGDPHEPTAELDMSDFLKVDAKHPEADIEGATRLGERLYWITSHARNKDGKRRTSRYRLWALDGAATDGKKIELAPAGRPYSTLLDDLLADKQWQGYDLSAAAKKAPKESDALNIEGLTSTPGGELWIGFRSPLAQQKALIAPLANPGDVIAGKHPKFGPPIELDLDGRGIRALEYWPARKQYVIVAGPASDGDEKFELYLWSGRTNDPPQRVPDLDFKDLQPETIVVTDDAQVLRLLSDDGTRRIDGQPGKDLPAEQRRFRVVRVTLDPQQ